MKEVCATCKHAIWKRKSDGSPRTNVGGICFKEQEDTYRTSIIEPGDSCDRWEEA